MKKIKDIFALILMGWMLNSCQSDKLGGVEYMSIKMFNHSPEHINIDESTKTIYADNEGGSVTLQCNDRIPGFTTRIYTEDKNTPIFYSDNYDNLEFTYKWLKLDKKGLNLNIEFLPIEGEAKPDKLNIRLEYGPLDLVYSVALERKE